MRRGVLTGCGAMMPWCHALIVKPSDIPWLEKVLTKPNRYLVGGFNPSEKY
jgi:hypothetical protein